MKRNRGKGVTEYAELRGFIIKLATWDVLCSASEILCRLTPRSTLSLCTQLFVKSEKMCFWSKAIYFVSTCSSVLEQKLIFLLTGQSIH